MQEEAKGEENIYLKVEGTGFEYRDAMRRKLVDILRDAVADTPSLVNVSKRKATESALKLEDGLYSKYKHGKLYAEKARTLIFNLKDLKNPTFKEKFLKGEISPMELLTMDPKKFASEAKKRQREEILKRMMTMNRSDWEVE